MEKQTMSLRGAFDILNAFRSVAVENDTIPNDLRTPTKLAIEYLEDLIAKLEGC